MRTKCTIKFVGKNWIASYSNNFDFFHLQLILLQANMWSLKPKVKWFDCIRNGKTEMLKYVVSANAKTIHSVVAPRAILLWLEWEEAWSVVVGQIPGWSRRRQKEGCWWMVSSWWEEEEGRGGRGEAWLFRLLPGSGEAGRGGRGGQDQDPGDGKLNHHCQKNHKAKGWIEVGAWTKVSQNFKFLNCWLEIVCLILN